jgi:ferredoxin-type protein NapF
LIYIIWSGADVVYRDFHVYEEGPPHMATPISRRQFLRADFRAAHSVLRPPWALREDAFVEHCTRCGDCLRACPQAILQADAAGFPAVDFSRGACSFCGACVEACVGAALTRPVPLQESLPPWQAKAVIDHRCLTHRGVHCEVCRDQCAPRAILFRPAIGQAPCPDINLSACNGCGACVSACPAGALRVTRAAHGGRNPASINNTVEVSCT